MSIKVMTMVWDGLPFSGSELLTMLAMADWCDDRGGSLFPSIKAVAEKVRVGEKRARTILRKFEEERYLAVVGNHFGGKPGTTREYRLNVPKLKQLADDANAMKEAEKRAKYEKGSCAENEWEDVFLAPPPQDTPPIQGSRTPPLQVRDGSPASPSTPPPQGSLSTIEPPVEPPSFPAAPSAPPPSAALVVPVKQKKPKAVPAGETELQAACRATWAAYAEAHSVRYGAAPVRNAKVNSSVKAFVQRLGYDESPAVAAFFVSRVNEAMVVRATHDFGLLLNRCESYRTQWATGTAMTQTRARQADQTEANYSAADEAIALMLARRQAKGAASA